MVECKTGEKEKDGVCVKLYPSIEGIALLEQRYRVSVMWRVSPDSELRRGTFVYVLDTLDGEYLEEIDLVGSGIGEHSFPVLPDELAIQGIQRLRQRVREGDVVLMTDDVRKGSPHYIPPKPPIRVGQRGYRTSQRVPTTKLITTKDQG